MRREKDLRLRHVPGLAIHAAIAFAALLGTLSSARGDQPARGPEQVSEGRTLLTLPDTTGYSAAERAILGLERARSAAIARHDTTWLARLYADDFRGVLGNGVRIVRSDLFRIFGRDDPVSRFLIDELSVRVYGDAGTVTGRLRTTVATGEVTAESRYLHVYALREGRWQIVAAQATPLHQATATKR